MSQHFLFRLISRSTSLISVFSPIHEIYPLPYSVDGQTFTIQLEFELKLKFADFFLSFNLNFIGAQKKNWESKKNSNSNKFTSKHRIDFIGTAWDNFIGINKIHDAHNIDSCIISEFGLLKGGASYRGAWNLQKCTPIDLFLFGFSWLFHKTSTHLLFFFFLMNSHSRPITQRKKFKSFKIIYSVVQIIWSNFCYYERYIFA